MPSGKGASSLRVNGFVRDPDGTPVQNASIRLWGTDLEAEAFADRTGYYSLETSVDGSVHALYAFFDDPGTPGFDLLPSSTLLTAGSMSAQINFTLTRAATLVIEGQLRPVESTQDIKNVAFDVVDPESHTMLYSGNYTLRYGTGRSAQNYYLGLDPSIVVVPADVPFAISVSSSFQYVRPGRGWSWPVGSTSQQAEALTPFQIVEGDGFVLRPGEVVRLDIRKYSLGADVAKVQAIGDRVDANITKAEERGFYTASERHDLGGANDLIGSMRSKLENAAYDEAYVDLRQAYLTLKDVEARLNSFVAEASFSVYVLIVFTAMTSVALAALLLDGRWRRFALAAAIYVPLLLYLHRVYPGSTIIAANSFTLAGAASIFSVLIASDALPMVLRKGENAEGMTWLGAIVAVFSIGKRNLRRRRVRLMLTSTSILVLVMSFVALTSLSTTYGLVYGSTKSGVSAPNGIMVRMPKYQPQTPYEAGWFYPIIDAVVEWAAANDGVSGVALKAENTPTLRPYFKIDGQSIFGILGVQPKNEPTMPSIDGVVVEGSPLREENTCLLHESVLRHSSIGIGDEIAVGGVELKVVGAFDGGISNVLDLDGESILPRYQVNYTPGADTPMIIAETCDPSAVVVTTLDAALRIRGVRTSRIDATLAPDADPTAVWKGMALAREYRLWISEGGAVSLAYLGGQLGGKGLPILVPWVIVVMNVVTTTMSSLYERRREVNILSSVGLNPSHIAGIFLAESSLMGVIAGGLGYLLGLGLYPFMVWLGWAPAVLQKVSAVWCLASLLVAVASAAFGALISLKRSTVLTPSLRRRWALGEEASASIDVWDIPLPINIEENRLGAFIDFIKEALERHGNPAHDPHVEALTMREVGEGSMGSRTIAFVFAEGQPSLGGKRTSNEIAFDRTQGREVFTPVLRSRGEQDAANRTGAFARRMIIGWTATRRGNDEII